MNGVDEEREWLREVEIAWVCVMGKRVVEAG
jgi:hypothetical protein